MNPSYGCDICEKHFTRKDNLIKHKRNVHEFELETRKSLNCPSCDKKFGYLKLLRDHIKDEHDIQIEEEKFEFPDFDAFRAWKDFYEKQNNQSYILTREPRTSKNEKIYLFVCHRSGFFNSKSKGERNVKAIGSKKMNGFCPSSLEVVVGKELVKAKLYKTHFGHDEKLGHLHLTETERREIAQKLSEGISMERILDDVRESINNSENIHRIHLLTKKDLHNICNQFNISHKERLHHNDAMSVKIWVEKMMGHDDSPILFYKEQGKSDDLNILNESDFQLIIMTKYQRDIFLKFAPEKICIDTTHGTNAYDFSLTTLLTLDEFGSGFPVGHCLSNRVDEVAMYIFFNQIKLCTGVIQTKVFMSDDAPVYYNAWKCVMGPANNYLLCAWHIDRSWRKNLSKIKGPSEKKVFVYKSLRVLLEETDKDKFSVLLQNFLVYLMGDNDTKEFGDYFKSYYAGRTEVWAYCFRQTLGLNTNMHLESMHKTLKHFYLEGKKVKREDKTIFALLKYGRDKIFQRLINLTKNVNTYRFTKIRESHVKSDSVTRDMITKINNCEWQVKSSKKLDHEYYYSVMKVENPTCIMKCELKCAACKVCIHMFQCTCVNNLIHYNICKHIHACILKAYENPLNEKTTDTESCDTDTGIEIANILQCNQNNNIQPETDKLSVIKQKINTLENVLKGCEISPEMSKELKKIENTIDNALKLSSENKSLNFKINENNENEPPNKKIKPQANFKSTKKQKKSIPSLTLSKPLGNEKKNIVESLSNPNKEVLYVHSTTDHTY